jgi:hypothetical protein
VGGPAHADAARARIRVGASVETQAENESGRATFLS